MMVVQITAQLNIFFAVFVDGSIKSQYQASIGTNNMANAKYRCSITNVHINMGGPISLLRKSESANNTPTENNAAIPPNNQKLSAGDRISVLFLISHFINIHINAIAAIKVIPRASHTHNE